MLDFFGDILDFLKDATGNYFWSLVVFALTNKLLFYIVYRDYYKSIPMGELLKEDIAALHKKHKNNEKKANEEITQLLMRNKYGMLSSALLFTIEGVLALLVGLILKDPMLHTSAASLDEFTVMQLSLNTSPLYAMTQKYFSMNSALSLFTVIAVVGLQVWHDTLMEDKRLVEQDKVDHVIWVVVALMCLVLPTGMGIFMLTFKIVDLLLYVYFSHRKYVRLNTPRIAKDALSSKPQAGQQTKKTK